MAWPMKIAGLSHLLAISLVGCARPPLQHDGMPALEAGADTAVPDAGAGGDSGTRADAGAGAACRFDRRDSPVRLALAALVDDSVVFVMTDGSARTVHRFPALAANTVGLSYQADIDQHRGRVVVSQSWWGERGQSPCTIDNGSFVCDASDRVVLLNGDGGVSWEKSFTRRASSADIGITILLGDGGDVFVGGVGGGRLISPEGVEETLSSPPIARPFAGPVVPIAAFGRDLPAALFAWWRPGDQVAATELSIEDPLDSFDSGSDRIFLATAGDGTRVVARARPERVETAAVPAQIGDGPVILSAGAWRGFSRAGGVVRFNLLTGEAEQLDSANPVGMRQMWAGLGDDGALLGVFRDDFMARLFRLTDPASTWNRMGKTLGQVEQVTVRGFAGTTLVDARGTDGFFGPTQIWQSAPTGPMPELLQTSFQIVRPTDGVDSVIDPTAAASIRVSSDGLCAAYWVPTASGLRLTVHDIARDTLFSTTPVTTAARAAVVVWIE